jgi:hypothetical protein
LNFKTRPGNDLISVEVYKWNVFAIFVKELTASNPPDFIIALLGSYKYFWGKLRFEELDSSFKINQNVLILSRLLFL